MKILFQIFILLAVSNVCFCICVDMCKAEKFSSEKCKEFCDCLNEKGYDEKNKDKCANEVGATSDRRSVFDLIPIIITIIIFVLITNQPVQNSQVDRPACVA